MMGFSARRWVGTPATQPPGWSRSWTANVALVTLLYAHVAAATQAYCSPENTGLDGGPTHSDFQSNGECTKICTNKDGGYAFGIVQGANCWCSNYIPAQQDPISSCSDPCNGYPYEQCGNLDENLLGYIQLKEPSGTAGASSATSTAESDSPSTPSTTSTPIETPSDTPTDTPTPTPTPTPISTPPPPAQKITTTTSNVFLETNPTSSESTFGPPSSASVQTSETTSATPSPVTSVQILTISNQPVTQTVTSIPTVVSADPGSQQPIQSSKGVSGGLIAGVVIAAVAVSLIIAAALFWCWRRRQRQRQLEAGTEATMVGSDPPSGRPTRNTSVLSKTGLLEKVYPAMAAQRSHANSSANGNEMSGGISPMSERRRSQPMFYDQRLNPATLMDLDNGSRVSVNTLPDNRDFSRTLNVTNPDPHPGWD